MRTAEFTQDSIVLNVRFELENEALKGLWNLGKNHSDEEPGSQRFLTDCFQYY